MHDLLANPELLAAGGILALWNSVKWFLLVLAGFSLVVFFHELGHFAVAKWAGIRVERFAVGFGPELFGFDYGQTRYSFNLLPLGGYVKMLGQEDFEVDTTGELTIRDDPDAFSNKPVGHRMAVVSAGVVMNLILAAVLFMIVYMVGKEEIKPVVGLLRPGSPAALAGLRAGDEIVAINGAQVDTFDQISMAVILAAPLEELVVEIERDGKEQTKYIQPQVSEVTKLLQLGVGYATTTRVMFAAASLASTEGDHLKPGDNVVAIDGTPLEKSDGLLMWDLVYGTRNQPAVMTVERVEGADKRTLEVSVPKQMLLFPFGVSADSGSYDVLGLQPRVVVRQVVGKSAADQAGLLENDVILKWGDIAHPTYVDILLSCKQHRDGDIPVRVLRDGKPFERTLFYTPVVKAKRLPLPGPGLEFEDDIVTTLRVTTTQLDAGLTAVGLRPGDVVVNWDGIAHPTLQEVQDKLQLRRGDEISVAVRRGGKLRPPISFKVPEATDAFLERLTLAEVESDAVVLTRVDKDSRAGLANLVVGDVIRRWDSLVEPNAEGLQEYLDRYPTRDSLVWTDRRMRPMQFSSYLSPNVGFVPGAVEESRILVADVLSNDSVFVRPTAGAATDLSKGCRILEADGQPLGGWAQFAEHCRDAAGREVLLTYHPPNSTERRTTTLRVPRSLSNELGLSSNSNSLETRNISLDGKCEVEVELLGQRTELSTQQPLVINAYLSEHVGEEVAVGFYDARGEHVVKTVTVTEDMVDAWYRRVAYNMLLRMSPETYVNKHSNPMAAIWAGATQTYYSVAKAYLTFQRMIFDRSVGIEKVSGPVGILHIGSQIAQISWIEMMYFLAFLSANLAVINFLPLPVVDGGLMVFLLIEKIKGSPVSLRVQIATQMLGLALILTTFLVVTYNDINTLVG
jgi:membrane-associated protease RseP (regulator of RpoE activity)